MKNKLENWKVILKMKFLHHMHYYSLLSLELCRDPLESSETRFSSIYVVRIFGFKFE